MDAFRIFEGASTTRLPRVYSYFDDIMWPENACDNEYTDELCAIREFNQANAGQRAIAPVHMMSYTFPRLSFWHEQIYVLHDFNHPLYCRNITAQTEESTQLPL